MNKLAKGLLIALVIATPVAIASPAFQAEAATIKTHHHVGHKANNGKVVKHKHHKHNLKHNTK